MGGERLFHCNCRLSWPAEEQDVAVGVADLEAAKAVMGILEQHAEMLPLCYALPWGRGAAWSFQGMSA
jgi:hypothetical protein